MPPNPRRILCVDDDEDTCLMLSRFLTGQGYQIETGSNAAECLELARRESFDLFVLDSWLPDKSGAELCREIREFDPRTPIIFYSAAAFESDIKAGLAAGADDYITKPYVEELIEAVEKLLNS